MEAQARTTGIADINGAAVSFEMARRERGPTLVLVHAGIADSRMWDDQFAAFADVGSVLRYDLRGYGKSTLPPGPYAHHEDLFALLAALDIPRAVVIGASMGGGVAASLAIAHPEMVQGLVLVNSLVGGPEPADDLRAVWRAVDALVTSGDLDAANELELRAWVDGPHRTPDEVAPAVRERVRVMNGALLARANEYEQAEERELEPPADDRLAEIAAPALAITGEMDQPEALAAAEAQLAAIPDARGETIANAAHLPSIEHPDEFNRYVLAFVESL